MKNRLTNLFIFTVGAAIGSAVTWKFLKTKYEKIADAEIMSVKEVFAQREKEHFSKIEDAQSKLKEAIAIDAKEKPDLGEYVKKLSESGYGKNEETKGEQISMDEPYIISPDEFGDYPDYETISLTYYADKVLTDEMDEVIDDVDEVVGLDSLNHFGEYEEDSVFVRNDTLKSDYEILLDERNYADVVGTPPHKVE